MHCVCARALPAAATRCAALAQAGRAGGGGGGAPVMSRTITNSAPPPLLSPALAPAAAPPSAEASASARSPSAWGPAAPPPPQPQPPPQSPPPPPPLPPQPPLPPSPPPPLTAPRPAPTHSDAPRPRRSSAAGPPPAGGAAGARARSSWCSTRAHGARAGCRRGAPPSGPSGLTAARGRSAPCGRLPRTPSGASGLPRRRAGIWLIGAPVPGPQPVRVDSDGVLGRARA